VTRERLVQHVNATSDAAAGALTFYRADKADAVLATSATGQKVISAAPYAGQTSSGVRINHPPRIRACYAICDLVCLGSRLSSNRPKSKHVPPLRRGAPQRNGATASRQIIRPRNFELAIWPQISEHNAHAAEDPVHRHRN
jgi:hypothetical protein